MLNSDTQPPAAVVFGCASTSLSSNEYALFDAIRPAGFILFQRNIESRPQLQQLVDDLRKASGVRNPLIMIDQEGGRVQRLCSPEWPTYLSAETFGKCADGNLEKAAQFVEANYRLIACDLVEMGINVNCAPVLDLPAPESHGIIGDRAFSNDPIVVSKLGRAACDGLTAQGVIPVIKHIPGHGRAKVDSHIELPTIETDYLTLDETDFVPFRNLRHAPSGMTAHVVYSSIDPLEPVSSSVKVIDGVIREDLGFDGLLFSDDVCMKALSGPVWKRVQAVLKAGCDIALHCDANFIDMAKIAETCPVMRPRSIERLNRAQNVCIDSEWFDEESMRRWISGTFNS